MEGGHGGTGKERRVLVHYMYMQCQAVIHVLQLDIAACASAAAAAHVLAGPPLARQPVHHVATAHAAARAPPERKKKKSAFLAASERMRVHSLTVSRPGTALSV